MKSPTYFLAANSFEGFISNFKDNYNPLTGYSAYIIKGGPGTGKSSFLKYVARIARKRGYEVTICPCSSDPDSLDGIIISELKIIIIDGTAPHIVEPVYPGVCEEIINLGSFWDSSYLKSKRFEIINITNINKALHKTASRYLLACGEITKENLSILDKYTKKDKVLKFAQNICKNNIPSKSLNIGEENIRYIEGVTPKGVISFTETITDSVKNMLIIKDNQGSVSGNVTDYIRNYALSRGYDIITVKNPYLPNLLIDHIVIPELSFAVVTERNNLKFLTDTRRIHARRFMDIGEINRVKNRLSFNNKIKNELLMSAIDTIRKAKITHDALEKYYISSMNFEKMTEFAENFAEKILK